MIRFLLRVTVIFASLLMLLIGAAIFVGLQQPPSEWVTLLHLDECELPCWIGIEPGKTTYAEAQQRIEAAYADASLNVLRMKGASYYSIAFTQTGYTLQVSLESDFAQQDESLSVVRDIYLQPLFRRGLFLAQPSVAELYRSIGSAEFIERITSTDSPKLALSFKGQRVRILLADLECDKVLPAQAITSIFMFDQPAGDHMAWLSPPSLWHGFNRCYNLEVKVYP